MSTELSELFDTDPLKLSEQDIGVIVARMRQQQAQQELGVPAKKAAPKKPKASENLLKELGLLD